MKTTRLLAVAFPLLLAATAAQANHLTMTLYVQGTKSEGRAQTDRTPPPEGANARPVVKLKAGEPIEVRWFVKNTDRQKPLADLVVYFFVVREEQVGQKAVPNPRQGAVAENVFAIELAPGASTHGSLHLPISDAGVYLVRIESLNTGRDHEHFAAVDVQVE